MARQYAAVIAVTAFALGMIMFSVGELSNGIALLVWFGVVVPLIVLEVGGHDDGDPRA